MEKLVLRFLKTRFLRAADQTERHAAFQDLHKEMVLLLEDPIEHNAFRYFDFLGWLIAHLEQRPFAEVLAERALPEQIQA